MVGALLYSIGGNWVMRAGKGPGRICPTTSVKVKDSSLISTKPACEASANGSPGFMDPLTSIFPLVFDCFRRAQT